MSNVNKILTGAIMSLAFSAAAHAAPINVGGVVFDPANTSEFDSGAFVQVFDTSTGTLSGWGAITGFANSTSGFCPGCELTYSFTGFQIDEAQSSLGRLVFTGGTVNLYVDDTPNFLVSNETSATDGNLWMSLSGHTFLDLFSSSQGSISANLTSGTFTLDVAGGPAANYFDTNTIPDFLGNFADILGTSSVVSYYPAGFGGNSTNALSFLQQVAALAIANGINLNDTSVNVSDFFKNIVGLDKVISTGSLDLRGQAQQVPEPAALLLLSAGFLALTSVRRRPRA